MNKVLLYPFFLLFIFIVLTIYNCYNVPSEVFKVPVVKSGDLVLLKTGIPNIMTYTQQLYDMSPYTHVGIVYVFEGEPFIVETHQIDKFHKSGLNVYPFIKRFNEYNGQMYINPLKEPISDEQQRRYTDFIRKCKKQTKFPENRNLLYNYVNRCIMGRYNEFDGCFNNANCAELVSLIMERVLGLVKSDGGFNHVSCKTPGILSRSPLHTGEIIRIK